MEEEEALVSSIETETINEFDLRSHHLAIDHTDNEPVEDRAVEEAPKSPENDESKFHTSSEHDSAVFHSAKMAPAPTVPEDDESKAESVETESVPSQEENSKAETGVGRPGLPVVRHMMQLERYRE